MNGEQLGWVAAALASGLLCEAKTLSLTCWHAWYSHHTLVMTSHHHKDLDLLSSWDPQPVWCLQPLTPTPWVGSLPGKANGQLSSISSRICVVTFEMRQDLGPSQSLPLSVSLCAGCPLRTGSGCLDERPLTLLTSEQQHVDVSSASLQAAACKCTLGTQQGLRTGDGEKSGHPLEDKRDTGRSEATMERYVRPTVYLWAQDGQANLRQHIGYLCCPQTLST